MKKIVLTEKRYLLKLNRIKQYLLLMKQKQKKFKNTNMYLNKFMVEKQKRQKYNC